MEALWYKQKNTILATKNEMRHFWCFSNIVLTLSFFFLSTTEKKEWPKRHVNAIDKFFKMAMNVSIKPRWKSAEYNEPKRLCRSTFEHRQIDRQGAVAQGHCRSINNW